jgi:hypothetical protein
MAADGRHGCHARAWRLPKAQALGLGFSDGAQACNEVRVGRTSAQLAQLLRPGGPESESALPPLSLFTRQRIRTLL